MNRRKSLIALGLIVLGGVVFWSVPSAPKSRYYSQDGQVFGTYYHLCYQATEDLQPAVMEALHQVDGCLSLFNDSSILARINRGEEVETDSLFEHLYSEAVRVSEVTDGAFDITVAPLVHGWGFGRSTNHSHQPSAREIDSILAFVGYTHIGLENHHFQKSDPRITLDASAIAKGLGCDCAAQALKNHGVENFLVEIGGEVVLQGVNEQGQPWRVGITRPQEGIAPAELQSVVRSSCLNMATSGNYRQFYYVDGQRRSHTIDPRTGYPVQHATLSATVTASSCMRADALATACMVLEPTQALEMIEGLEDAACYLIVAQGDSTHVCTSKRWVQETE